MSHHVDHITDRALLPLFFATLGIMTQQYLALFIGIVIGTILGSIFTRIYIGMKHGQKE